MQCVSCMVIIYATINKLKNNNTTYVKAHIQKLLDKLIELRAR